jgi:hypothetical protein
MLSTSDYPYSALRQPVIAGFLQIAATKTRRRPDIGYNARPFASLAQLVERRPYKANVGGSTPSGRTRI